MSAVPVGTSNRESSDLIELLQTLWAGRWWIIGGGLLFAIVAGFVAFTMTPIYRSTTVLIAADKDRTSLSGSLGSALGSLGGIAALADFNLGSGGGGTEEALAVLTSREFSDKFIAERQLMPILFDSKWDAQKKSWNVPPGKEPTAARAFKYFDRNVRTVLQDKKTGLITLQIEWKDRQLAASWANELVQRLNAEMQRRAIAQAEAALGFLEKELAATNVLETRSSINRLVETQINRRMVANVTEQYAFRVVDRAVPSDADDRARPKRSIMIIVGGLLGGTLAGVLVLVMGGRFASRKSR